MHSHGKSTLEVPCAHQCWRSPGLALNERLPAPNPEQTTDNNGTYVRMHDHALCGGDVIVRDRACMHTIAHITYVTGFAKTRLIATKLIFNYSENYWKQNFQRENFVGGKVIFDYPSTFVRSLRAWLSIM